MMSRAKLRMGWILTNRRRSGYSGHHKVPGILRRWLRLMHQIYARSLSNFTSCYKRSSRLTHMNRLYGLGIVAAVTRLPLRARVAPFFAAICFVKKLRSMLRRGLCHCRSVSVIQSSFRHCCSQFRKPSLLPTTSHAYVSTRCSEGSRIFRMK